MDAHVRSKKLKFFIGEMTIFSGEKRSTAYTFSVQKDLIIVASVYFRKFCARAHARAGNGNKALEALEEKSGRQ